MRYLCFDTSKPILNECIGDISPKINTTKQFEQFEIFRPLQKLKKIIIFSALITFVTEEDPLVWRGYMYALLLFGLSVFRAIINQQHFYGKIITGQRVRSALTAAVYRKVNFKS